MAWAALGKAAMGAVKGGARMGGHAVKRIAKDKLLGRGKKKPQKPGVEQEDGGALAIRPTTTLMPTGPTGIVPSAGGALATIGDSGGTGGGQTAEEIAVNISTKIIRVERLLKGSAIIKKDIREDARIAREKASDKKQEAALEKAKPKDGKGKGPKLNLPGKGLLSKIFGFFGAVILGRIAFLMVDWIPKLTAWLPKLGAFVDAVIDWSAKIIDGMTVFIDKAYDLYDKAAGWVKNQFGDEAHEKFTTFMGNLKELIKAFLVWKLIGEKIFKGIVSAIRNVWKTVTKAIRTIWVKLRRLIGRKARMFFSKLVQRAGGALKAAGQGVWNVTKGLASKAGGLFSKGGSKLAQTGAGKVVAKVGGWAGKIFGKAAGVIAPALKGAMPAIKGFAKRIPIFGSLIVGIISLMSGEPLGQALFKTIGAAVGGALGTFIPIPILGTLLGEILGAFVGDLLYYTIIKRDPGKALELVKGALSNLFKGGKAVFNWVKNGFGNFITNFKQEHMVKLPKVLGVQVKLPGIGDKIPNLLQLYNPFAMAPLLVKSFFGGGKSGSKKEVVSKGEDDVSKGLERQEEALISANQKKGYEGVMKEIESYAPYEDLGTSPITVNVPSSGGNAQAPSNPQGSSQVIAIGGGGGGEDPYEVLEAFG